MLGHRGIGSATVAGLRGSRVPSRRTPAIVSLSGVEVPTWEKASIGDTLGGRSTASVRFVDFARDVHPEPGETVRIAWQGLLLFAGTVDSVDEEITERNDDRDALFTEIRCVDWTQYSDRYYVAAAYTGKTLREILTDVLEVQTGLAADGITLGSIADVGTIDKVVFNYARAGNVFRDLAELTGLAWNVDFEKRLHFFDRSTFQAPIRVGDDVTSPAGSFFSRLYWNPHYFTSNYWPTGSGEQVSTIRVEQRTRKMSYSKTRENYRNKEWLRAGHDLTDLRTEYFRGDSTIVEPDKRRRTFNLSYEVGELISIVRDGVPQRIGIKGVDKDSDLTVPTETTWPHWFYQIGEREISQNAKEDEDLSAEEELKRAGKERNLTLTSDSILAVTYRGRFPMIVEEFLDEEIAARAAREGGTGIYEVLDEDTAIDGRELGKEKARRLLALYGRIPAELKFEVDLPYLVPGHLLEVTVENFGIAGIQFLVDRVTIDFVDHTLPRCQYVMLDGDRQGGWADFFRKLADAGRRTVIRENEVVVKTARMTETLNFADIIEDSENGNVQLESYVKDPYTFAMVGLVVVGSSGEEIPMGLVGRSVIGNPYGS